MEFKLRTSLSLLLIWELDNAEDPLFVSHEPPLLRLSCQNLSYTAGNRLTVGTNYTCKRSSMSVRTGIAVLSSRSMLLKVDALVHPLKSVPAVSIQLR